MINSTITHYRITAKLGQGGMGEVYRATDTKLDRDVAIKILPGEISQDADRRKRFIKEAKAASSLNHPHVCTIYEVSETADGQPFIAMEFLPGQTLADFAGGKPLDNEKIVAIGTQIADALDAAHSAGIVHRDIKPENIHIDSQGRVKVLDFGLAKIAHTRPVSEISTAEMTEPGKLMGTPDYMSPEQARSQDVDHRSDLFSVGIVLYELTTGRLPFSGSGLVETMEKITGTQPEAMARFNYEITPELERIICKCLEKKPEDRYQTAKELLIDFRRLERQSSALTSITTEKQRSWWGTWLAAVCFAIVLMAIVGSWWSYRSVRSKAFRFGKSVAVLPFESTEEYHYVSDGLGQELSGRLSQLEGIRVPPFSTSDRLTGDDLDVESIANELEVSRLLRGSIQRSTQTLKVSARLINPHTNSLIWHDTYEYDQVKEMPFDIYEKIALSIAQELDIQLSGEQEEALRVEHTSDARAWKAYLEGLHFWEMRGADLWRAKRLFELALAFDSPTGYEKDSKFALAWVGLADTYTQLATYGMMPRKKGYSLAIEYAEHALDLDPSQGDAHATLGFCQSWYLADLEGALSSFDMAQRLNPRDTRAYYWPTWTLLSLGRDKDAIETCKEACRIDPLSDVALFHLCYAYWATGDAERAEETATRLVVRKRDLWLGHFLLARVLLERNKPKEALEEAQLAVELSGRQPMALGVLGRVYAAAGRKNVTRDFLEELTARSQTHDTSYDPDLIALHVALGNFEKAIEYVRKSVEERNFLFLLHFWPDFRPLWQDPRFIELVNQAGVAQYNPDTKRFDVIVQADHPPEGVENQ